MRNMPARYSQFEPPGDPAGELAMALDSAARRIGGGQWRCRCPAHDDHDPCLDLRTMPGGLGVWICRAGCSQDSVTHAIRRRGTIPDKQRCQPYPAPTLSSTPNTISKARALFDRCLPITRSIAEIYLRSRCADMVLPPHSAVRFLPANPPCFPWPAMASLVTDFRDGDKVLTVHLTFLRHDGNGKAGVETPKRTLAGLSAKFGVVRLVPDQEVTWRLGVSEGIEKSLSIATAFARDEGRVEPVWSGLNATNLAALPVLRGIETLVIYGDPNEAGRRAVSTLAGRWLDAGREVITAEPDGPDWDEFDGQ
jgi:hypothetical protein